MPVGCTCCGVIGVSINTVTSAATLMAASQPSTSLVGSVSATPTDWQYFTASWYDSPLSILERMMLVVALRIPLNEESSASGNVSRKTENSGEPPSTVDSNPNVFPFDFANAIN